MSRAYHGSTSRPRRRRGRLVIAAAVVCRVVLVACNGAAIYTTAGALRLDGEWHADGASIMAAFGALFAAVTGFVTLAAVRLVGARWLVVPAVVFAVAFARGWYLDTVYPPPPD